MHTARQPAGESVKSGAAPSAESTTAQALHTATAQPVQAAAPSVAGRYEFVAPAQIVFGWGRRRELGSWARGVGNRALVVWGSRHLATAGLRQELFDVLAASQVRSVLIADIAQEPTADDVDRAVARCRTGGIEPGDFVLAVGGGSALDLGKALAGVAPQPGKHSVRDYLEGVGSNRPLERAPLPVVALPTTAGTGSEATKNAVIAGHDPPFKKSLRAAGLLPRVALVDPELTVCLPAAATIASGLDAITQLFESYLSRAANPLTQALCLAGLQQALPAIEQVVAEPASVAGRSAMAQAALWSGLALANSGLGLAHGVAAALGAVCGTTHGLACAVLLPIALEVNRDLARERLAELAWGVGASDDRRPDTAADALIHQVRALTARLGVPARLAALGVRREQMAALVAASHGNSLRGNPRAVDDDELADILERHW